ncbi:hypothetical protein ACWGIB_10635 [Streptomyces xiamenensis]
MWRRRLDRAGDLPPRAAGEAAHRLAHHLQAGGELAPVAVDDFPRADGEVAFADVVCSIARFYGTDVVHPRLVGDFEYHPTFGQQWVSNRRLDARRLREARDAAEPQWRDHNVARVVLTSMGVRLKLPGSPTWLPFDHALLSGLSAQGHGVVLSYTVCAPLLLAGAAAPWLGVAVEHLRNSSS